MGPKEQAAPESPDGGLTGDSGDEHIGGVRNTSGTHGALLRGPSHVLKISAPHQDIAVLTG